VNDDQADGGPRQQVGDGLGARSWAARAISGVFVPLRNVPGQESCEGLRGRLVDTCGLGTDINERNTFPSNLSMARRSVS
jgi:hypothetical protein